jgi:hypothetical protein
MTQKTKTPFNDLTSFDSRKARTKRAHEHVMPVPGLKMAERKQQDVAAINAMTSQRPGSVKEGFDNKPALPPHRRSK